MATTVFTGWRAVTPGACDTCGSSDDWECDGRGNIMCGCQACPGCGIVDAYGFHNAGCSGLDDDRNNTTESSINSVSLRTDAES